MPDNWEGVLILLAVTAITVAADWARRAMPVPKDEDNYEPPRYPDPDDYVPTLPVDKHPESVDDDFEEFDEGGGEEDEGA